MKLSQSKFIWTMNNIHASGKVIQDTTSITRIELRPGIEITHDYKKHNLVTITFKDGNATYEVPDSDDLMEICRLHLMNKDAVQILREHCEKYLKRL